MTGVSVKATMVPKIGASISMLRRGLASGAGSHLARGKSKEEKVAIILRLRQREEETKKYGAPLGQAIFFGAAGILALAVGFYGPYCHAARCPCARPRFWKPRTLATPHRALNLCVS